MTVFSGEYRREAAYAIEMADKAPNQDLRAHWLRLARKWLDMLPEAERQARGGFETARQDSAAREENSPAFKQLDVCG